jgi:hypothetical protein
MKRPNEKNIFGEREQEKRAELQEEVFGEVTEEWEATDIGCHAQVRTSVVGEVSASVLVLI